MTAGFAPLVVKLGGSLVLGNGLDGWLDALIASRREIVIVPGGARGRCCQRTAERFALPPA